MRWNLRMVAAQRGIWKAADLRRALAEAGLEISAGKMSHLWSSTPISVRLDDLDVICHVLACEPGELLLADPPAQSAHEQQTPAEQAQAGGSAVRPSRGRNGRRLPPA
jgi:putative transcriptional regulator